MKIINLVLAVLILLSMQSHAAEWSRNKNGVSSLEAYGNSGAYAVKSTKKTWFVIKNETRCKTGEKISIKVKFKPVTFTKRRTGRDCAYLPTSKGGDSYITSLFKNDLYINWNGYTFKQTIKG